jgi:hypothetical protein
MYMGRHSKARCRKGRACFLISIYLPIADYSFNLIFRRWGRLWKRSFVVWKHDDLSYLITRDRCYDFENIFAEKFSDKICVFYSKQSKIMQKFDHNIGFWEKRQFFAENCQKSPKILIITSTPGIFLSEL